MGGFLTKSRRGEVFKGEGIITKRRERGEGKCSKEKELLPKEGKDWREGRGRKSYNLQVKDTADFLVFNSFSQVGTYFM